VPLPALSPRAELARLALRSALGHADVLGGVGGRDGVCVSVVGGERLRGVTVAAAPAGGYSVVLRLRTRMVPLLGLADDVRQRVRAAAVISPRAGRPGSIEVQIVDVEEAHD